MSLDLVQQAQTPVTLENEQFYKDVIDGLSKPQKRLSAKYFYDAAGDQLFQDIMNSEDYYLTRCEMEIFTTQIERMIGVIGGNSEPFSLVELGPGDCTKSIHLLRGLLDAGVPFTYMPIDISQNVLQQLETRLPAALPGIRLTSLNGDYFEMLDQIGALQNSRRVVLCLGANIGNMLPEACNAFCNELRSHLAPGDIAIIGFDLKKNPRVIQAAYNDREGITRLFNLNLLKRINTQLHADFDLANFEHYAHYDPQTGASKSYLVCLKETDVHFPDERISFKKDECIWMEISQKYTLDQIDELAQVNHFEPLEHLMDHKQWFTDAIWIAR